MPKPILIIGIGTSGMHILEQVQHFCYENTGRNRPLNVGYLFIETDENSLPGVTAIQSEIKRIHISLGDRETMVNNLKENKQLDTYWLPPTNRVLDADFGAGGWPSFGRAALWGLKNLEKVSQAITQTWVTIGGPTNIITDDSKPAVFITGSLTGGTGAGVFIDLAYLVRFLIKDVSEVYGLFTIPGEGSFRGNEIIYSNTLAALQALDHYTCKDHPPYKMQWPNGILADFEMTPYTLTQFVSQDNHGDVPPIQNLAGLEKMTGLFLFLNLFGMREKRITRLGDAMQSLYIKKYGTFGISAIQYPKAQLEEFLSIELTTKLFERWINPRFIYLRDNPSDLKFLQTRIFNDIKLEFDRIIRSALELFDSAQVHEGERIIHDIADQSVRINKKEFNERNEAYAVFALFTSQNPGNYYDAVHNYIPQAVDEIIHRIYTIIVQRVDQYENLFLAKMQLKAFIEAIDECLNYWRDKIQLSGDKAKWDIFLEKQIGFVLKNRYKILFEQDSVLNDRLLTIFELMKMHLIIPRMIELRNAINASEFEVLTQDGLELPTLKKIEQIISIVSQTIGYEERSDNLHIKHHRKTLKLRQTEIESDIKDTTIPVLRIFPAGNFIKEVDKARNNYQKIPGRMLPSKTIYLNEQSLWKYLTQNEERLVKKLYDDFTSSFENDLRQTRCIPDFNLGSYVEKQRKEAVKIARRATFPMVKINYDKKTGFGEANQIPRFIIGQDQATISRILDIFKEENFPEFRNSSDGIFVNPELRNIIVFYVERGYMIDQSNFEPLKHLRYIKEIEELYKNFPKQREISEEEWHIERNPYMIFEAWCKEGKKRHEKEERLKKEKE
jgi:hypothetical protein